MAEAYPSSTARKIKVAETALALQRTGDYSRAEAVDEANRRVPEDDDLIEAVDYARMHPRGDMGDMGDHDLDAALEMARRMQAAESAPLAKVDAAAQALRDAEADAHAKGGPLAAQRYWQAADAAQAHVDRAATLRADSDALFRSAEPDANAAWAVLDKAGVKPEEIDRLRALDKAGAIRLDPTVRDALDRVDAKARRAFAAEDAATAEDEAGTGAAEKRNIAMAAMGDRYGGGLPE